MMTSEDPSLTHRRRLVVTLGYGQAHRLRGLAARMGTDLPEVQRRALAVLEAVVAMDDDEVLVAMANRDNGVAVRKVPLCWER